MTADLSADSSADLPVGMAYLLGNWATNRRATTVVGRLGTADLYQACLIFHRVSVAVDCLLGMTLKGELDILILVLKSGFTGILLSAYDVI